MPLSGYRYRVTGGSVKFRAPLYTRRHTCHTCAGGRLQARRRRRLLALYLAPSRRPVAGRGDKREISKSEKATFVFSFFRVCSFRLVSLSASISRRPHPLWPDVRRESLTSRTLAVASRLLVTVTLSPSQQVLQCNTRNIKILLLCSGCWETS